MRLPLSLAVVLAVGLACGGLPADEAALESSSPGSPEGAPAPNAASLDHRVAPYVPKELEAASVEAHTSERGTVEQIVRYDLPPQQVRAAFVRHAEASGAEIREEADSLVRLDFSPDLLEATLGRIVVAADEGGTRVTVTAPSSLVSGWWPEDPACGPGRIRVEHPWPAGGSVSVCFASDGYGSPDGPFRIERDGQPVVDGTYAKSSRDGRWRMRDRSRGLRVEGTYERGRPVGTWQFGASRVSFEDGLPLGDTPWVELLGDPALTTPSTTWSHEVLDADLASGLVAVRQRYVYGLGDIETASCGYAGMKDPQEGVRLAILSAGRRAPVGVWDVYASVREGTPCTTEADAKRSLAEAKAAMASRGLDPGRKPALVAPVDGVFTIAGRRIEVVPVDRPISVEEALSTPDLLRGDWTYTPDGLRVDVFEVKRDGEVVQRVAIRSDRSCAGGHEAQATGAIHQGDRVALLWEGVHRNCTALDPFVLVGPVWRL